MNTTTAPSDAVRQIELPHGLPSGARTVFTLLQGLRHGSLTVRLPDGRLQHFGSVSTGSGGPNAVLHLRNWNACTAALKSGDIGFAESYLDGDWTTPHLPELLQLLALNRQSLDSAIYGHWAGRLLYRLKHLLNRNTRANSRRNIHAHYDLGNDFYALWLDPTMNYSSGWFEASTGGDPVQAQHAKVRRALSMAGVQPGHRVLEIGCGWGALAEKAATEFGATVTGVTLSNQQLDFARARMARAGVAASTDLRLQDYRDIDDAPFDAICSVEMIEAVGREYWPVYFQTIRRLLKPGARACIQSIVIDDGLFDRYLHSTDFIQQYIFPGGCLPSPAAFRQAAEAAGLKVVDELAFGTDYATTCRHWREAFLEHRTDVLKQGFDERFLRIWDFYLAYCEAGFLAHNIDVVQFTLQRP